MSAPIRVLIIDDDALVRAGLTMLLAGAGDIEIVGEAADGSEVEGAVEAQLDRGRGGVLARVGQRFLDDGVGQGEHGREEEQDGVDDPVAPDPRRGRRVVVLAAEGLAKGGTHGGHTGSLGGGGRG